MIDFVFVTPKGEHGEVGALSAICVVTKMTWYRPVWGRSALDAAWALYAVVMDSAVAVVQPHACVQYGIHIHNDNSS